MRKNITNHDLTILLSIIFLGFMLRLALVGYVAPYPERYIQSDAIGYNQLALNLVSGHGFSMESTAPFTPDNFRTPIYPLTIALVYLLFGYHPDLILWLQVFMGTLTILLVFLLAERIGGRMVGLIAAALLAISPPSITYSALLWSDTEYTMFFMISLLFIVFMFTKITCKWMVLGGIVSGIAVLTHPRSMYLPYVVAIVFVGVMIQKNISLKRILVYAGTYLLAVHLVLFPWRYHNYIVFGIPNITSAAGINMLYYGAALTEATLTGEDQWSIADRYDTEVKEKSIHPLNAAEYGESAFKLGMHKIIEHPFTYAKVHLIGMVKIFLPGTSQINTILTGQNSLDTTQIYMLFTNRWDIHSIIVQSLSKNSLCAWCYIGFDILYLCWIYCFTFYTFIKRKRCSPWLWFFMLVLFYLAVVAGQAGSPRFSVVMMPLFSILAAYGMLSIRFFARKMQVYGSVASL